MPCMTYLVLIAFIAILASLGSALYFMLKGGGTRNDDKQARQGRMARALAFRVGFSVLLFVCILVAWKFGYIQPTGIPAGR